MRKGENLNNDLIAVIKEFQARTQIGSDEDDKFQKIAMYFLTVVWRSYLRKDKSCDNKFFNVDFFRNSLKHITRQLEFLALEASEFEGSVLLSKHTQLRLHVQKVIDTPNIISAYVLFFALAEVRSSPDSCLSKQYDLLQPVGQDFERLLAALYMNSTCNATITNERDDLNFLWLLTETDGNQCFKNISVDITVNDYALSILFNLCKSYFSSEPEDVETGFQTITKHGVFDTVDRILIIGDPQSKNVRDELNTITLNGKFKKPLMHYASGSCEDNSIFSDESSEDAVEASGQPSSHITAREKSLILNCLKGMVSVNIVPILQIIDFLSGNADRLFVILREEYLQIGNRKAAELREYILSLRSLVCVTEVEDSPLVIMEFNNNPMHAGRYGSVQIRRFDNQIDDDELLNYSTEWYQDVYAHRKFSFDDAPSVTIPIVDLVNNNSNIAPSFNFERLRLLSNMTDTYACQYRDLSQHFDVILPQNFKRKKNSENLDGYNDYELTLNDVDRFSRIKFDDMVGMEISKLRSSIENQRLQNFDILISLREPTRYLAFVDELPNTGVYYASQGLFIIRGKTSHIQEKMAIALFQYLKSNLGQEYLFNLSCEIRLTKQILSNMLVPDSIFEDSGLEYARDLRNYVLKLSRKVDNLTEEVHSAEGQFPLHYRYQTSEE